MLEEQLVLNGDGAYNAHFGESMAALGDIDDDGFPGRCDFLLGRFPGNASGAGRTAGLLTWLGATWCPLLLWTRPAPGLMLKINALA